MKKLLSLLSVLTISGTAIPITIAASPYQKQHQLNSNIIYSQTNNKNLKINKREISNKYIFEITKTIITTDSPVISSGVILNNKVYFGSHDRNVYEYDPATEQQKIVIRTDGWVESSGVILNNKVYFGSYDHNVYEYNPVTGQQKIVIRTNGVVFSSGVILNNKVYFGSRDKNLYQYNPLTGQQKIVIRINNSINSSGVIFNNKLYFGSSDNNVYEYDPATGQQKIVIRTNGEIISSGIALNNKLYFGSYDHNVYEYNPVTGQQKIVITTNGEIISSGIALNSKLYFGSSDNNVYEYDPATGQQKIVIRTNGSVDSSGVILNNELYFGSRDKNVYQYNPLTGQQKIVIKINGVIVSSGVVLNNELYFGSSDNNVYKHKPIFLEKQNYNNLINIKKIFIQGIYFIYKKENKNSIIKNIEFDTRNLIYSDIELIKEEELPVHKNTENICVGDTDFENSLSTEQKFKTQSCKYTKQKINSIQVIKGINKRIDNTLETGESSSDTTSTTNSNTKTTSVNVGAEVSAGWGPFSVSVSTSVGNEESNTYQRENSESKTKNISKIISNSASFDLSNLKEEQEIITNELEYPSQEITVAGNQIIKVIFNLNKIIKKYKVTFKQNIDGKIKAKIKNENDEIIEQEFSIKDIMLTLKENNILPKEIIINNNLVSFIGELIVSKNSSKLKVKTEEIDAI